MTEAETIRFSRKASEQPERPPAVASPPDRFDLADYSFLMGNISITARWLSRTFVLGYHAGDAKEKALRDNLTTLIYLREQLDVLIDAAGER